MYSGKSSRSARCLLMPTTGYPSATSFAPGAAMHFHLSASQAGAVNCVFERVGSGAQTPDLNVVAAAVGEPSNDGQDFQWPAHPFTIPATWPSGFYQMKAKGPGDASHTPVLEFVVRAASPGSTSKILFAADFITEQAYNGAGGRSLYEWPAGVRGSKVSFRRPVTPLRNHLDFIRWLGSSGYVVEYASLVDLHTNPALLDGYDCLIFGPHAEYWSKEMRDQVEAFVEAGGNVMSLSGNTCFRQVRFENDNQTLVGYKNAKADLHPDLRRQTVAFAQPPVNRPPNTMLGVGWTHGAFRDAAGPAVAYQVHFPAHWALAGAPLAPGNLTNAILTYETDANDFAMEDEGYPRVTGEEATPLSTVVLASADVGAVWHGKPGMATVTLMVRHGMVFACGTTDWFRCLAPGAVDPAIDRITRNVLDRFRGRRVFDWELIGHANDVVGMAAVDSKLFCATGNNVLWRRFPVLAEVVWSRIGHANHVVAMAATRGLLFAVTRDRTLWYRRPVEAEINWTPAGTAPVGLRALCGSGSTLYAIDATGALLARPATKTAASWTAVSNVPARPTIVAMTSYNGVLLASTSDNRLLRTGIDFPEESRAWVDIHHCNFSRALAVVDGMLFVATTENRLWWLDLRHGALDALSAET